MKKSINFRPVRSSDERFLYKVFVSTRPDIMALNATETEKNNLYITQFKAQTLHYRTYFSDADFLIVLYGKDPVGKLSVHRGPDEIRVIDIAILPAFRDKGIGTKLMLDILQEGCVADKPVRIHVEKYNRAFRFYERLGFVTIAEKELHWFLECKPNRKLVVPSGT